MTGILIPASRLSRLRQLRGLIERTQRNCLCCSREFMSAGPWNRVCDTCKSGAPAVWVPDLNAR